MPLQELGSEAYWLINIPDLEVAVAKMRPLHLSQGDLSPSKSVSVDLALVDPIDDRPLIHVQPDASLLLDEGHLVNRFAPRTRPEDADLIKQIKTQLDSK